MMVTVIIDATDCQSWSLLLLNDPSAAQLPLESPPNFLLELQQKEPRWKWITKDPKRTGLRRRSLGDAGTIRHVKVTRRPSHTMVTSERYQTR